MIDFEHGALRRKGEPVLAGTIAHGVMDHRDARAFSFLNAAALLDLEQWSQVIEAEVERRRTKRKDLDRAIRRLRALVTENEGKPIHRWLIGFVNEIAWAMKIRSTDGHERLHSTISGMLTAASFAILYGDRIGERELALIHAPFEPFIPLTSLG
jgi:predicted thioredoxin/glutaredoxin